MPARTTSRRRSSLAAVGLVIGAFMLALAVDPGEAVEVPPTGGFYIQTGGPNAAVTIGDWYSSNLAGAGNGYHYVTISVPCGWQAATPLHVDLFSPEMNRVSGALVLSEEPRNDYDSTQFELYGPGAVTGPGYGDPAPGTGIVGTQVTYQPGLPGVPEAWVRYATLVPVACGSYILRSAVLTTDPLNPLGEGDDDNGWRLRVGTDDDADPTNAPPANADDPDGVPGTNDELVVGQVQISYQQSTGGVACMTLFEYVAPGQPSVPFHNFDMDGNARVRYYAPSDTFDATGLTGGTVGTISTNGAWNQGTLARGGDVIANPESGWWRIVTCIGPGNQFIQEAQAGIGIFYSQPPTPALSIAKTDGVADATAGSDLTYVVTVTNTSAGATAGAGHAVLVTDTVPANAAFASCAVVAPATGSCTESAGVVTASINGWINAGASAQVEVVVTVDADAAGTVSNLADVAFEDALGNVFPAVTATDVDGVNPAPPPTPTPTPSPTTEPDPDPTSGAVPDTQAGRGVQIRLTDIGLVAAYVLVSLAGIEVLMGRRPRTRP